MPRAGEDAESALDITMKGVEARVCGIDRYFPFVYPYYEENDNNFGMMDKHATPLRSFAAYAQLIRILHGSRYRGDLKVTDTAVQRARVFSTDGDLHAPGGLVAVIYTGRRDPQARVKLDVPVVRLEGIDGRLLHSAAGEISVPDGLAYVWLSQGERESHPAARDSIQLIPPATPPPGDAAEPALRTRLTPIVMRYLFDGAWWSRAPRAIGSRPLRRARCRWRCGSSICPTRGGRRNSGWKSSQATDIEDWAPRGT